MLSRLLCVYRDIAPHKRVSALILFIGCLLRNKFWQSKAQDPIWLIGEARGECLEENGYHFFRYCRVNHPESAVYFVISHSSPHFMTLAGHPNVLTYGSIRHIDAYVRATTCFYTHTYSDFAYREHFILYRKGKKVVYLHHGVLGFKKFDRRYVADRNLMDLFTVGSVLERKILVDQAGVSAEKVKVTGYARYDAMEDSISPDRRQIAYIPTHRNWLRVPTDSFRESDFFRSIDQFINDPAMHELLARERVTLKVYLHAVMQDFSNQFVSRSPWVKIVRFGEVGPLRLICDSQLLITDYSSVAWDFLYLGKPVLFYRFDLARYMASRGSYLPLDRPLFGDICFHAEELVDAVAALARTGFALADPYRKYRDGIMPIIDRQNCQRIYDLAKSLSC